MGKTIRNFLLLTFASLFIFSSGVFAEPVSLQMAEDVARTHLRANNERERLAALTARKVFEKRSISMPDIIELQDDQTGETLAYVLGLTPKGFIVVSPDTDITPVIAYSFKGNFPLKDFQDNVLLHMVTWDMENRLEAIPIAPDALKEKNKDLWEKYLLAENSFLDTQVRATTYGPYLDTTWDQGDPVKGGYNDYCPLDPVYLNLGYDRISLVGCVATAMAQIVNYHQYPSSVTFTSYNNYWSVIDPKDGGGTRYIYITATDANMSSITYPAVSYTAAMLSKACGVSVEMGYSAAASGANTYDVATALKNKFGYASATAIAPSSDYTSYGVPYAANFYSRLQGNMQSSLPAQLAIAKTTGFGHSIVCDGYNTTTDQYHLNYGWGSSSPTPPWWYALPSEMPSSYSIVKYGILDIKPPPGGDNYCTKYGPCSAGQGDCDGDSECQSGLTCVNDVGPKYGWKSVTDV
ncbi:MAG: C10 family peptidase, partial [Desulfobacteraceae bacterium]|nr:C10 family peptidase [Desulfobacteraceae bacterium]